MPVILKEDESKRFGGRQITLPQYLVDALRERQNLYSGKEYKQTNGYKRLNSLLSNDYNKRSDRKDRQHNGNHTISFSDAKRIVHDMKAMNQSNDNVEYDMIGGDQMRDFLNNSLRSFRNSVTKVKPVPEVPRLETKDTKPDPIKNTVKLNGVEVTVEGKAFNEMVRREF